MRGPCKGSCGLEFLRDNTERQQSSASDAKRVVDTFCSAGALDMRGLVTDSTLVLSARACEARIVFVENLRKTHCQHSRIDTSHGKHDEQLDISSDELLQLAGSQQHQRLVRLYHSGSDSVILIPATEELTESQYGVWYSGYILPTIG